ncbi:tape measure protein [Neobacillus sedimentimangrovi]|uniref:Tape measure protein n=1 Tax=Neobacillus sedimentimangrovi TaxID=2699460 RepID=A0ABS8QGA7_9BACI|nr:tape measure protein [Neobacillus sedimentimangrovi]MCD4838173.1 tape measure protein [Neobacillus sedimentimangrovi]
MARKNSVEIVLSARDQASSAISKAFGQLEGASSRVMGVIKRGAAVAGAALATLTGVVGKVGISYNAMMEQSAIAWETILGSQKEAKKTLEQLQIMGAKTPFEFEGLDRAAKLLNMAGYEGDNLFKTLTAVGDAVSAVGGSQEDLEGISMAIFQMASKSKISAEEMNQLAERGIPGWQMIAEAQGKSVQEIMKMSENGKLMAADVLPQLTEQLGKTFGGAMQKQSSTFNGLMSTLWDKLKMISAELTKPLFDKLKSGLEMVMPYIEGFLEGLQEDGIKGALKNIIPPQFMGFVQQLAEGFNLAKSAVMSFVEDAKSVVSGYIGTIKNLFSGEGNLGESFSRIFESVKSIALPILQDAVSFIKDLLDNLKQFWDENGQQIIQAVQKCWSFIASVFEFFAPVILFILKTLWESVKGVISGALDVIMGLIKVFSGLFTGDFSKMWEGIKQIFFGAIEAVWNFINLLLFGRIIGGIKGFITKAGEGFTTFWSKTVEIFKNLDTHVWNIITSFASKIGGILKGFVDEGIRIFGTLRTFGANIFQSLWTAVRTIASNIATNVVNFFRNMYTGAKTQFDNILSKAKSIFESVKNAITNPIDTAKTMVGKAIEGIKRLFLGIGKIKIPLPHFVLNTATKKIMGKTFSYPTGFDVEWYDKGGVFYGPQIIGVGEKRPEFVGALDDLRKIVREEIKGQQMQPIAPAAPNYAVINIDGRQTMLAMIDYIIEEQEFREKRNRNWG